MTTITLIALPGCFRAKKETRVEVARATKLPEEVKGFMRLMQSEVTVNVVGSEEIGIFEAKAKSSKGSTLLQLLEKLKDDPRVKPFLSELGGEKFVVEVVKEERKKVEATAYIVLHEQDVAQFVRNTKKLKALLSDPEIAKIVSDKKLLKEDE